MEIIEEYRRIIELIAVVKSKIATAQREYERTLNAYRPSGISGIDYSKDRVQNSHSKMDVFEAADSIIRLQREISELRAELDALYHQKRNLQDTINQLGDLKKQILMYRVEGFNLGKIAWKLNYSKRQIERLHAEIKKDVGEMSVINDVI